MGDMSEQHDVELHERVGAVTNEIKNVDRRIGSLEQTQTKTLELLTSLDRKIDGRLDRMDDEIRKATQIAKDAKAVVDRARKTLVLGASTMGAMTVFIIDRWEWLKSAVLALFGKKL